MKFGNIFSWLFFSSVFRLVTELDSIKSRFHAVSRKLTTSYKNVIFLFVCAAVYKWKQY